jgi:HK97 family phage major capsid protein
MKDRLKKLLAQKELRKADLIARSSKSEDVTELRGINTELEGLNGEIAELRGMIEGIEAEEAAATVAAAQEGENRSAASPIGGGRIVAAYGVGKAAGVDVRSEEDPRGTMEYRKAFMNFVLRGVRSEALEMRADATAATSDISAIIPSTIMNKVVEKMADFGRIFARVTKTNVKGGVSIPISSVKPTASWVSEGSVSEKKKMTITGSIVFGYNKLQVRVAETLEADTVSLALFENLIAANINEAMVVAMEESIMNGDGTGEFLGITKDTGVPADQIIEVDTTKLGEYDLWTALLAKMPRKYRNGAVIILNDADFNKYIVGMVDANGQPVARVTYGLDGTQSERFLGKEVIAVEDYIDTVDGAAAGDVFGVIVRLEDYMINSNMQMTFRRYFDENTDEWINKSTVIADGKLADKNGVVILKKK